MPLFKDPVAREALIKALSSVYDIERLCSRIAYGSINARDCQALVQSLLRIPQLVLLLEPFKPSQLRLIGEKLDPMEDIAALLQSAIDDDPPISVKEGGFIRDGYNEALDQYRSASQNGKVGFPRWKPRSERIRALRI